MPISTVEILKCVQQCCVKWFGTISSLGAPDCNSEFSDGGEPSVLKQGVYVRGPRSSSLSLSVLWMHNTSFDASSFL